MTEVIQTERLLGEVRWLERLARGLCGDDEARAADVAQETMARAIARPPRVGSEGPRPWLATVARNVARRIARRERVRTAVESRAAQAEAIPGAAETVARAEVHRAAVDAVLALAEPYRSAVLLRFLEDLPPRDVAARLDAPVETVRTWVRRGLDQVRARLDQQSGGRRAWLAALGLPPAVTTVPWSGVVLMGLKSKLIAAAVLVAACGVAAWAWTSDEGIDAPGRSAALGDASGEPRVALVEGEADAAESRVDVLPDGDAPSAGRAGSRRLHGIVLAEESRRPLRDVEVAVLATSTRIGDESRQVATTRTAADGSFAVGFDVAPERRLAVVLRAPDRAIVREDVRRRGEDPERASAREDLGDLLLPPGTAAAGRVITFDGGLPVADAGLVIASDWVWLDGGARAVLLRDALEAAGTTDSAGRFVLRERVVAVGRQAPLLIAVTPSGLGWTSLDGLRRDEHRIEDVEIVIQPSFDLEVGVIEHGGAPAADIMVRVEPAAPPIGFPGTWSSASGPLRERFTTRTDRVGFARVCGLPIACGSYRVYVGADTSRVIRVIVAPPAGGRTNRRIDVQRPASARIRIHGEVTDGRGLPVAGAVVRSTSRSTTVGADGRYELFVPRGANPFPASVTAPGHRRATRVVDGADGRDDEPWNVRLAAGADLVGVLVDRAGAPIGDARVRAGAESAKSDAAGFFRLEGLPAEEQVLTVTVDGAVLTTEPQSVMPGTERVTVVARRVPSVLVPMHARVVDLAGRSVEVEFARVEHFDSDGDPDGGEAVDLRIGAVDAMLSYAGRWRLTVLGYRGAESSVDFEIDAAMLEVRPTVVVTEGITIDCEVEFDVPTARVPKSLTIYADDAGQNVRFEVGDASVTASRADLDPARTRSFRLHDVDASRPVVLVWNDPPFVGRRVIDPRATGGVVKLSLQLAGQLEVRSTLPWPLDELGLELRRADEEAWREPLRFEGLHARTDPLRWNLEPALWHWRVAWPEGVSPSSGEFRLGPGDTATITLTPRRSDR